MKTKKTLSLAVSLVLAMGGAAMLPEDAAPAGGVISVSANDIVTDDFVFWINPRQNCVEVTDYTGPGGYVEVPGIVNDFRIVRKISGGAFEPNNGEANKTAITGVQLPDTIDFIGNFAFGRCENLESINLPEGLTEIGTRAFEWCKKLNGIVFPSTLKKIGSETFTYCESLTGITLPKTLESIGTGLFSRCQSLSSVTIEKGGLASLPKECFKGCTALKKISIPGSVKEIGDEAFSRCSALSSVTLAEGVTKLGVRVFNECPIKKITIPKSVTEIGDHAVGFDYNSQFFQYTKHEDLVIRGYMGSAAEKYAELHGFAFEPMDPYELGDVNKDRSVNMKDIAMFQRGINGWTDIVLDPKVCDMNGSGSVNMKTSLLCRERSTAGKADE